MDLIFAQILEQNAAERRRLVHESSHSKHPEGSLCRGIVLGGGHKAAQTARPEKLTI